MAGRIPLALLRRGRKKQKPPTQKDSASYQDRNDPNNDMVPDKEPEVKVKVGAIEATVTPGPDKAFGTKDDEVKLTKATPKPKAAPEPEPVPEPAPEPEPEPEPAPEPEIESDPDTDEEPEYSMDNTKAELLAAAEEMGIDVNPSMKKSEILDKLLYED